MGLLAFSLPLAIARQNGKIHHSLVLQLTFFLEVLIIFEKKTEFLK
jgi:hypothetical protein